jgi:hypothetical protein
LKTEQYRGGNGSAVDLSDYSRQANNCIILIENLHTQGHTHEASIQSTWSRMSNGLRIETIPNRAPMKKKIHGHNSVLISNSLPNFDYAKPFFGV